MEACRTEPDNSRGWLSWIARHPAMFDDVELTPLRLTLLYLTLGFAALYGSEAVLPTLLEDPALRQVQAAQGGVEVLLTGALIFALTRTNRTSLRETTEELEAARQELEVLHRVLRHNFRNNLTIIAGYAAQLKTEATDETLEDYGDAIETTCEEFSDTIGKTKHLADLHATGRCPTRLDLSAVFDRIERTVAREYPTATIDIDRPDSPDVLAHPHIEFALRELIDNAVVHNPAPAPTVAVTAEQPPDDPQQLRIHVEDDGPGVPEPELKALRQQEESPLLHGSGVGLWVAQWIVIQSDGTFDIENLQTGCRVTMTLPTPHPAPADIAPTELAALFE